MESEIDKEPPTPPGVDKKDVEDSTPTDKEEVANDSKSKEEEDKQDQPIDTVAALEDEPMSSNNDLLKKIDLDQYKGVALIGLEYTIELRSKDSLKDFDYYCILCDSMIESSEIIAHWTSYDHRLKYISEHYTKIIKECHKLRYDETKVMRMIVDEVAGAIERTHGRLKMVIMNKDEFSFKRRKFIDSVHMEYHPNEYSGPDFVDIISNTYWLEKAMTNHDNNDKEGLKEKAATTTTTDIGAPTKEIVDKKLPTPDELSLQAAKIAQEQYKREKYLSLLENQMKMLDQLQETYKRTPENHPEYFKEWKNFWNRRYKELQQENKHNPSEYDYKPEWMIYWTARSQELYEIEVERIKSNLKMKLALAPNTNDLELKGRNREKVSRIITLKDDDIGVDGRKEAFVKENFSITRIVNRDPESSTPPSFRSSESYEHYPSDRMFPHCYSRPHGFDDYVRDYRPDDSWGGGRVGVLDNCIRDYKRNNGVIVDVPQHPPIPVYKKVVDDTPKTVVDCLRLLTALEDQLGSLAPKVIQLLSSALAMENNRKFSSKHLMEDEDNRVLLETVKEKLKGVIIADVVDDEQKIKAIKKAIKSITLVFHEAKLNMDFAERRREIQELIDKSDPNEPLVTIMEWRCESPLPKRPRMKLKREKRPRKRVRSPDPVKITKILTESLKGVDITPDDIDKLVNFYLLVDKIIVGHGSVPGIQLNTADLVAALDYLHKIQKKKKKNKTVSLHNADTGGSNDSDSEESSKDIDNNKAKSPNRIMSNDIKSDTIPPISETTITTAADKETTNAMEVEEEGQEEIFGHHGSLLETLTDSDLQTLLQNFKRLSKEEQHHLIAYLRRLESTDMDRVEKLRKYVNMDNAEEENSNGNQNNNPNEGEENNEEEHVEEDKPISTATLPSTSKASNLKQVNDKADQSLPDKGAANADQNKISLDDDDDDDYNFDEVCKTVSMRINNSKENKKININLKKNANKVSSSKPKEAVTTVEDAKNVVANIMNTLRKRNSKGKLNASGEQPADSKESTIDSAASKEVEDQPTEETATTSSKSENSQKPIPKGGKKDSNNQQEKNEMNMGSAPFFQGNVPFYQQQQQQQIPLQGRINTFMNNQRIQHHAAVPINSHPMINRNYNNTMNMMGGGGFNQWNSFPQQPNGYGGQQQQMLTAPVFPMNPTRECMHYNMNFMNGNGC